MSTLTQPAANSIGLRKIPDLEGLTFLVPQYQRGYRWTETQVTELLDDLLHFREFREASRADIFYCLQPVLVKRVNETSMQWEVIDGQQRLTTLHLLYGFIQQYYQRGGPPLFTLCYSTRPDSQLFLESLNAGEPTEHLSQQAKDNIDFHFMYRAWASMKEWFNKQRFPGLVAGNILSTLLERTQLIWYELAPGGTLGEAQQAYIRINSGKIPLTNAELIKALFLKRAPDDADLKQFERRQLELAAEWDRMEAMLRQPELWYFLNENPSDKPTRVEFLFELLASLHPDEPPENPDAYTTFRYFNKRLQRADQKTVLKAWSQVKALFMTLEEWYVNPEWYHQLGYLITVGMSVKTLLLAHEGCTKTAFKSYVRDQLREQVSGPLEQWTYKKHWTKLRNVLLLFNIETLRKGGSYRFPFQHYKNSETRWSLEHIHAQNSAGLCRRQDFLDWLGDVRGYVEQQTEPMPLSINLADDRPAPLLAKEVLARIDQLCAEPVIEKTQFEEVQRDVLELLGEPNIHTIENLALLSTSANAVLSNGVFAQKRQLVADLERDGSFIPIATRNVFLKYYSRNPKHLTYWTVADRDDYVRQIRITLAEYLTPLHAN